jgi:excisionase family DNA binding protein
LPERLNRLRRVTLAVLRPGVHSRTLTYMKGDAEPPLLRSLDDTCFLLGVGRTTLYRLVDEGQLHQVKVGRRALITAQSITDYVAALSA